MPKGIAKNLFSKENITSKNKTHTNIIKAICLLEIEHSTLLSGKLETFTVWDLRSVIVAPHQVHFNNLLFFVQSN